jgi:hypothetical protein
MEVGLAGLRPQDLCRSRYTIFYGRVLPEGPGSWVCPVGAPRGAGSLGPDQPGQIRSRASSLSPGELIIPRNTIYGRWTQKTLGTISSDPNASQRNYHLSHFIEHHESQRGLSDLSGRMSWVPAREFMPNVMNPEVGFELHIVRVGALQIPTGAGQPWSAPATLVSRYLITRRD